jgi:hypothetical protein
MNPSRCRLDSGIDSKIRRDLAKLRVRRYLSSSRLWRARHRRGNQYAEMANHCFPSTHAFPLHFEKYIGRQMQLVHAIAPARTPLQRARLIKQKPCHKKDVKASWRAAGWPFLGPWQ